PHLLRIHHVGQTEAFLFYVMEPADDVAGGPASSAATYRPATLQSRLQNGPLPPEPCLRFGRQLLEGLASLHSAGMVHRDVKPANCLFVDGPLKLADFGLLTAAGEQVSRVGTRGYMPPDGRMDARADVYATGLVLYEMLTGLPPEEFPSLGERAREIAASPTLAMLNRLILRACEPEPERRFADARAMLAAIRAPAVPRAAWPVASRRWAIAALACLLVAAVAATTALWPTAEQPVPEPADPARMAASTGGVEVNFISEPAEATIYVDGELLVDADGKAFQTPCTVPGLTPGVHHVVLKHVGRGDQDGATAGLSSSVVARLDKPTVAPVKMVFGDPLAFDHRIVGRG
ncbi:MAG: serine/threonine protein kinase, partial [Planctomycetia bacterium]|nr:serine/threonine protein kinase [Planctomycetia bacterium]